MPSFLIDTNVLVYLYDAGSPVKRLRVREGAHTPQPVWDSLLERANSGGVCQRGIAQARSGAHAPTGIEQVSLLMDAWPVLHLTPQIMLEALCGVRDHRLAYYDAQIWACARLNQVPVVLSEDFQDGSTLEGVRFVNPFEEGFTIEEL